MATTVGMVTLGCSKNRVDSEQMLSVLTQHGYQLVENMEDAEVIIVNTCGFIQAAKEEAISTLFEMAEYKTAGRCKVLAATGCFAQRYPDAVREEMPEVDVIMGVNEYEKLDKALQEALSGARPVYTDDDGTFFEYGRVLTTPRYSAYIRIGEGCDNFCSFCAIPLIRGAYRSRPEADILAEVRRLADEGVREFTLIAQDTTRWGTDDGGESRLPELIEHVAAIPGVKWLRVLYCYPERVDERLLDTMMKHDNVCKYLDLPMQHISQRILTEMNRSDTTEHIREVVCMFKERGMLLRTTMMVGFPGETQEDFDQLMDFVREAKFDRLGAFTFCPEEGTLAATMPDQIDEAVKQERYDKLMRLQHSISLAQNRARIGEICEVVVEKQRGSRYVGRSMKEAPEVDGTILFTSDTPLSAGQFVQVKLTGAKAYDLMGEMIHE